jgi:hypothetical protein
MQACEDARLAVDSMCSAPGRRRSMCLHRSSSPSPCSLSWPRYDRVQRYSACQESTAPPLAQSPYRIFIRYHLTACPLANHLNGPLAQSRHAVSALRTACTGRTARSMYPAAGALPWRCLPQCLDHPGRAQLTAVVWRWARIAAGGEAAGSRRGVLLRGWSAAVSGLTMSLMGAGWRLAPECRRADSISVGSTIRLAPVV